MGRVIKTISLDSTSARIAENIPNFSQWVRQQLLLEWQLMGGEAIHLVEEKDRGYEIWIASNEKDSFGRRIRQRFKTDRCNPYHVKGRCNVCWPEHLSVEEMVLNLAQEEQERQGIKATQIASNETNQDWIEEQRRKYENGN